MRAKAVHGHQEAEEDDHHVGEMAQMAVAIADEDNAAHHDNPLLSLFYVFIPMALMFL